VHILTTTKLACQLCEQVIVRGLTHLLYALVEGAAGSNSDRL